MSTRGQKAAAKAKRTKAKREQERDRLIKSEQKAKAELAAYKRLIKDGWAPRGGSD